MRLKYEPCSHQVGEVGVMQFGGGSPASLVHALDAPLSDATGADALARFTFRCLNLESRIPKELLYQNLANSSSVALH